MTFLKTSASEILSAVFEKFSPSNYSRPSTRKLGVALAGLGYYSERLLAPALQSTKFCELRGIVTGSAHKIPLWQKKYGIKDKNVYSYDNMWELANNPDIDIVYIVTPTCLHKQHCLLAAAAGKHVWCEKPMAMAENECKEMISACKSNGVQLALGYRMHHEPITRMVMKFAKKRPYGRITRVVCKVGYSRSGPPQDHWRSVKTMGGGALYDMGVYTINAARYATGLEPIAIIAKHETHRSHMFKEVDESTSLFLEFPDGIVAECATSVGEYMNSLQVDCKNGWYRLEPFQSYRGVKGMTSDGIELKKTVANQQVRQMENDALAILHNSRPLVPGTEGMRDIRVIEAAFKSAAQNIRVTL